MKVLNITLKKQWFDLIKDGIKLEEYREIKPYWETRLLNPIIITKPQCSDCLFIGSERYQHAALFDIVSANNGYAKGCPNIKWKHKGIRIGEGKPEWGAEPGKRYFILEIGELINQEIEKR